MKDLITVKTSESSIHWKLQKIWLYFCNFSLSLVLLFQNEKVMKEYNEQLYTSNFENLDEMNKFIGKIIYHDIRNKKILSSAVKKSNPCLKTLLTQKTPNVYQ